MVNFTCTGNITENRVELKIIKSRINRIEKLLWYLITEK